MHYVEHIMTFELFDVIGFPFKMGTIFLCKMPKHLNDFKKGSIQSKLHTALFFHLSDEPDSELCFNSRANDEILRISEDNARML